MSFIQKLFTSYHTRNDGNTRIGEQNRIWYDSITNTLRIQLDDTPGGTIILGGGGSGGIQLTDLHVDTAAASNGGSLTYNNTNGHFTFSPADLSGLASETWVTNLLENYNDLGNLSVGGPNLQTISGSVNGADIVLNPNGGSVQVPRLKVGTTGNVLSTQTFIEAYITTYELVSIVDYSTGSGDNLTIGAYGNINGVSAPWTVFELSPGVSGIPVSTIAINDVLTGAGIIPSTVKDRGAGGPSNAWDNYVIVNLDLSQLGQIIPITGAIFSLTRPYQKAGFDFSTQNDTDIFLSCGGLGDVITNANILPVSTNIRSLGSPNQRWKEIYLGSGTIYVQDETLGVDQSIGARDGLLYVQNGAGLRVGEFTLQDNKIRITDPTRDIEIGISTATGRVLFNRPVSMVNNVGISTFIVQRDGRVVIAGPDIPIGDTLLNLTADSSQSSYIQPQVGGPTLLQATNANGIPALFVFDNFGSTGQTPTVFTFRGFRGSIASPSVLQAGDQISAWANSGYAGYANQSGLSPRSSGSMRWFAAETFTSTSQAAYVDFAFQQVSGTGTLKASVKIDSTGLVFPSTGWSGSGITFTNGDTLTYFPTPVGQSNKWLKSNGTTMSWQSFPIAENPIIYKGTWNAFTNTPVLSTSPLSPSGTVSGWEYSIGATGTRDIGSGSTTYEQGGFVIYNGTNWEYIPPLSGVSSIQFDGGASYTGSVHVQSSDIVNTLDTNSIPNNKLVYNSITVTTGTGLSGGGTVALGSSITLNNTGVLSISAGTGISVSGTNNVTISNTGLLSITGTNHITATTVGTAVTVTSDATTNATNNTIALRDSVGGLTAKDFTATQDAGVSTNHGPFNYGVLSYSDIGIMADFSYTYGSYNQVVIQNTNPGSNASSNFIVSNDQGTADSYYGEFGMNSSGFTGPGSMDIPNAVYLASASSDLIVGTLEAQTIHFVTNANSNPDGDAMWIDGNGIVYATDTIQGTISSLSNHTTTDLAEGTNKYYTDARARQAIHLTSNTPSGTTSTLTYDNSTGYFTFTSAAALISGSTIKTVNGNSLLGSGDVSVGTVTSISSSTLTTGGTSTVPTINLSSGIATAGTYGSASLVPVVTVDTYGRITNITTVANPLGTVTNIATSGTVSGITLTGGPITSTGTITLGGSISGLTTSNLSSSANIANGQLANSTISGVSLGGNLYNLTAGTNVTFSTGTTYNGSQAITINVATGAGYTLPIAGTGSGGTLGGVKVDGTTITINGTTGVISAPSYTYSPTTQIYALAADYTIGTIIANQAYSLFGVGVTVASNTRYEFEINYTNANGPNNKQSLFAMAGTATITRLTFWATSISNNPAEVYFSTLTPTTLMNLDTANVSGSTYPHKIKGIIETGVNGGTIIPQVGFITDSTGVTTKADSYMRITPFGSSGSNTVIGTWA